jgi:hypothetical protein
MKNITLITSIIDTPNIPLSYIKTRSVFNRQERFEQTQKTILSVREKIPDNKILLIECSLLSDLERNFFQNNVDYFINVWDTNNENLIRRMFTISKSMGEGTMTIIALQFLFDNNIIFNNLFKISGRYWLNNNFNYSIFDNLVSCIRRIDNDINNMLCCFYKLSYNLTREWLEYLINSEEDFINCKGYEVIFANFLLNYSNSICNIENKVGINGYISVCGELLDA